MFDSRESITGIDLGAAGVKLARARAGKGIRRLLNVGLADFPSEGAGSWAEKAGIALRGLLADQGLKPRDLGRVLVAVSGPSVHLRQVEMPVLSETELRSSLRYEARQHLPLENLGEAALDCQVIEGMAREEGSKQSVLMVGAPDSLVQSRIQVLNGAGIDPEVVDVAPLALLNALEGSDPEAMVPGRTVAIADLGQERVGAPLVERAGRNDVGVAGEAEHRALRAEPGPEVVYLAEAQVFHMESKGCEPFAQHPLTAAVVRGDRAAGDERLREFEGSVHRAGAIKACPARPR